MEQQPGAPARAESFKCPTCTADMTFDAGVGMLRCGHCGATVAVDAASTGGAVVEHSLDQGLARAAAHGLGAPVTASRCAECGATVSFGEGLTSTACEFCGSAQVLAQEASRKLIRPESVVPFKVDRDTASLSFRRWLGGLWFRPSDLQRRARVGGMSGVYVPYWTFDASVQSRWTAEAGYYYWVTETYMDRDAKGNAVQRTRQVRHTRWEPARGARRDRYDDVLVCASRGLPEDLARRLGTFDTGGLVPYDPRYLAGWKAEEYAVDLDGAWARAVQIMEAGQRKRCAADVPGDTHRNLGVTSHYGEQTFKHVLLPVWISSFRYGGKPYQFLVNGQTGQVEGKAPWSVPKIVQFAAAMLLALGTVVGVGAWLSSGG